MGVSGAVWALTIVLIAGLMIFDYTVQVRNTHVPTLREAAIWSTFYIGIAILFGIGVVIWGSPSMGIEYFAGYLSNEALSVDNLFVFLVIIGSFGVPRVAQQKVLLFGIAFALVARTGFIVLGAALIESFNWAFYLFGLGLLIMAVKLANPGGAEDHDPDSIVIRLAHRFLRTSEHYNGDRLFIVENDKRVMTPLLLVMVAIGGSDLLFAFDSVPAMFGLTQNVFLVFAATAFSLMGLRQLYFLIDNLLDRLVYLSYGLALILGFIGSKLVLQALHDNNIPFINHGKHVAIPEISTLTSLIVIVIVLAITAMVSLFSRRGRMQNAVTRANRHAREYLELCCEADPAQRDGIFTALLAAEREIDSMPTKYRAKIKQEGELRTLLQQARDAHATYRPEN